MKRYDQSVPADFKLGVEKGIFISAQISEAIEKGVSHFKSKTYEHLPTVEEIMTEIDSTMTIISWHKDMKETIGLHDFVSLKNILIPMPEEMKELLGGKGGKDGN